MEPLEEALGFLPGEQTALGFQLETQGHKALNTQALRPLGPLGLRTLGLLGPQALRPPGSLQKRNTPCLFWPGRLAFSMLLGRLSFE